MIIKKYHNVAASIYFEVIASVEAKYVNARPELGPKEDGVVFPGGIFLFLLGGINDAMPKVPG